MRTVFLICETQVDTTSSCGALTTLQQRGATKVFAESGFKAIVGEDSVFEDVHYMYLMCATIAYGALYHTDNQFEVLVYERAVSILQQSGLLPSTTDMQAPTDTLLQVISDVCAVLGTQQLYIKSCLVRGDYWRALMEVTDLRCKAMVDLIFLGDSQAEQGTAFAVLCNAAQLTCLGLKLQNLGFDVKFQHC